MKYERPGHTLICLRPEKPLLLVRTGTVASHLGDYGAVSLAFSDIITRNLVYSGKQTYAALGTIVVTLAEARTAK